MPEHWSLDPYAGDPHAAGRVVGWVLEKKTPQGALSMLVYTLWFIWWSVIIVFATKWKKANRT